MFTKHSEDGYVPAVPGITRKTLVHGERTLLSRFHLAADSQLPRHSHPNEQTGYMITGHMRLTIGDVMYEILPGDAWNIPAGLEHHAEVLEDSVVIEVFSPLRQDYLP